MASSLDRFLYKRSDKFLDTAEKFLDTVDNLKDIGRKAPYISKKSFKIPAKFHGIDTVHVGNPLTRAQYAHLDEAVSRMKEMYPEVHESINDLFLANSKKAARQLPEDWEELHDAEGISVIGFSPESTDDVIEVRNRIGLKPTAIKS